MSPGSSWRARNRPDVVLVDRGYASGIIRRQLRRRDIRAAIPEKRDSIAARKHRGSIGAGHRRLDAVAYQGRNLVEWPFAWVKQWQGLATQYDKLAVVYRGAAVLYAIITWLRVLGDIL